jgi:hypothetical protein
MRKVPLTACVVLFLVAGGATVTADQSPTLSLQTFDPSCGQPEYNCRGAFQKAFAALAKAGGGTLQLPAGIIKIAFPEIPQNVRSGPSLTSQSLIVVPASVVIQGVIATDGTYASVIQWSNTNVPAFVFANASHSGMRNLHLQFTGTMPTVFSYFDFQLQQALGYKQAKAQGGPYELFSFAYVFNSDNCTFDHLLFDSATHDNEHVFGVGINLKGKGVIERNGAGFSSLATGNSITNIQLYDFVHGFLTAGQNNLLVENITADRRGSTMSIAPGHVLYTTALVEYDSSGTTTFLVSTNVTIQNITEGPDSYSNVHSAGTLSTKFINGGSVNNIQSQHPKGLDETAQAIQNMTFTNMTWSSDYPICQNAPDNCYTAKISFAVSPTGMAPSSNLTFKNINLKSTEPMIAAIFIADNLTIDGMHITTSPNLLPAQSDGRGIVETELMNQGKINNYTYSPLITSYDPTRKYNSPFRAWNNSSNVNAAVTINWPQAVPVPKAGSFIIDSRVDNVHAPQGKSSVTQTIVNTPQ